MWLADIMRASVAPCLMGYPGAGGDIDILGLRGQEAP